MHYCSVFFPWHVWRYINRTQTWSKCVTCRFADPIFFVICRFKSSGSLQMHMCAPCKYNIYRSNDLVWICSKWKILFKDNFYLFWDRVMKYFEEICTLAICGLIIKICRFKRSRIWGFAVCGLLQKVCLHTSALKKNLKIR